MRVKHSIIFIFALIISFGVSAQRPVTMQLEKGEILLGASDASNGLALLTGKEYYFTSKLNWKISLYNPDLTLRYQVPVKKASVTMTNKLVVSPTGNNVYLIQYHNFSKPDIMHIDSSGVSSNYKIKRKFKQDQVNVVFCDDEYLYYVVKEQPKKRSHKRGIPNFPKLKFVRIDKDNVVSNIDLELPEPDKDATEWSYLGHTNEVSYFSSKTIVDFDKATYRIAVVDAAGTLEDDFKMDVHLKNNGFVAGSNYTNSNGTWEVDNHNVLVTTHTSTSSSGHTTTYVTYTARPEAFGNIAFDPLTNGFYIYGLAGAKVIQSKGLFAKKVRPEPSSFYVFKFDQDGKKAWDYQGKLSGVDDYFKSKALFVARSIKLTTGLGGLTRFQTFSRDNINTFELNTETGAYQSTFSNKFENNTTTIDLGTCHNPKDKSELGKFLTKNDKGNFSMLSFRLYNTDIIVKNFFDDWRLELYKFDAE